MKIVEKHLGQSAAFRKLVGALVIYAVIQIFVGNGTIERLLFCYHRHHRH